MTSPDAEQRQNGQDHDDHAPFAAGLCSFATSNTAVQLRFHSRKALPLMKTARPSPPPAMTIRAALSWRSESPTLLFTSRKSTRCHPQRWPRTEAVAALRGLLGLVLGKAGCRRFDVRLRELLAANLRLGRAVLGVVERLDPATAEEMRRDARLGSASARDPQRPVAAIIDPAARTLELDRGAPQRDDACLEGGQFLTSHPELGDVSRGELLTIRNFYELMVGLITPVQMEGLRLLLTPFPQEEFNQTEDRKVPEQSLGVTCLDCHSNFHTNGAFHLTPDVRPQAARFRLETTSLRGMFNQQIHGSKRSLRSVEDFIEFEQRTAYFNGDHVSATRKYHPHRDRLGAQRRQVGRDVACIAFGHAHIRHHRARVDGARIPNPADHIGLGVRQDATDIAAIGDCPERRPDESARTQYAWDGMATATAVRLNQRPTAFSIAFGHRPPRLIRPARRDEYRYED
jgi:hypothetical protein